MAVERQELGRRPSFVASWAEEKHVLLDLRKGVMGGGSREEVTVVGTVELMVLFWFWETLLFWYEEAVLFWCEETVLFWFEERVLFWFEKTVLFWFEEMVLFGSTVLFWFEVALLSWIEGMVLFWVERVLMIWFGMMLPITVGGTLGMEGVRKYVGMWEGSGKGWEEWKVVGDRFEVWRQCPSLAVSQVPMSSSCQEADWMEPCQDVWQMRCGTSWRSVQKQDPIDGRLWSGKNTRSGCKGKNKRKISGLL